MDRLSSLDVSFLTNESSSSHMHVGGILIFEGPPPRYEDLLQHVTSRLHLVPRFRQKLTYPPAQTVPLNVEIGSHRRFVWVRSDLAQFKKVKNVLGGTVNDVVLAVVAGALRDWLQGRGVRTEGLELRAQVPVSIRATDERGQLGNRLTAMRAPLPVYVTDPVRRLHTVSQA